MVARWLYTEGVTDRRTGLVWMYSPGYLDPKVLTLRAAAYRSFKQQEISGSSVDDAQ